MSANPCDRAQTSSTGGRTGLSRGPKNSPTPTTDRPVFKCPEWIPDEPVTDRIIRQLRDRGMLTVEQLCSAADISENTLSRYIRPLVESGTVEAGFLKLPMGNTRRQCRAYRVKP